MSTHSGMPWWSWAAPAAGFLVAGASTFVFGGHTPIALFLLGIPVLFASVFGAVHHAEVAAVRLGQPFGFILLALAVTVIEASLIVKFLMSSPEVPSAMASDTVFASIMIALNGIVGLCLMIGGVRFHAQTFHASSASGALGVLGTLAVLALVLPNFTLTEPGAAYAPPQLIFVAIVSLALYALFLYVQMVRHRGDFLDESAEVQHIALPDRRGFLLALGLLPLSLLSVVLQAEVLVHRVDDAIVARGFPEGLVGVIVALIVLMPEGLTALKAAASNRLQTSINVALGSALASLCLTIPAVAVYSLVMDEKLILGLSAEHMVLLVLSLFVATQTLTSGRTTILQGGIHLVIFFAFLAISAIP